jgi:hypothetical protein
LISIRLRSLLLAAAAVVVFATAVAPAAAKGADDKVIITGDSAVPAGETVGDLIVVDGDVNVAGNVDGNLVAIAGDVNLSGTVDGDVVTVAGRARLGRSATVTGDLSYGDEKPLIAPGAEVRGDVSDENFDDISAAPWGAIVSVALWIAMTLSLLVLGIMLVAMTPRVAEATAGVSRDSLWESIAIGIAFWIGIGLIGGFALFTLVGIPLALILFSAVVPAAALGYVAASFALGRRVAGSASPILAFLAGFAILRALALIPILGGLVGLLAATFGVGFLIVAASRAGSRRRGNVAAASAGGRATKKPAAATGSSRKKPAAKKAAAKKSAAKRPAATKRAAKKSAAKRRAR